MMLEQYKKKRDFKITPEPSPIRRSSSGSLAFVVQKHSARRLHYDFRLELDGVLKSWALPNGPSLDPEVKRLAVMVEDHPLNYASFEGVIPEGEYGAGQVIVWDKGTYFPLEDQKGRITKRTEAEEFLRGGLEKGKISFFLEGSKLKGSWALVRMQRTKNNWLLIKHRDEFASAGHDIQKEDHSVLSGLTIEKIKKSEIKKNVISQVEDLRGARKALFPATLSPMLATLVKKPFSDPEWLYEPKLDGYRTLAFVQDGKVKLLSRRGLDVSTQYPHIVKSLSTHLDNKVVLDGEIVALDENGRTCFQCLQNHLNPKISAHPKIKTQILYYVFDILYQGDKDLQRVPLYQRKLLLAKTIKPDINVRLVEYFENDAEALFEASISQGLEGIMAKLKQSTYEDGMRSKNWLKIKATQSDEFIICGYTRGTGSRTRTLGALIIGSYDRQGQLVFAGHVGTGFDENALARLREKLDAIKTDGMPFSEKPAINAPTTWVKPELVAEIKFAERTKEGFLRAPVFLRLRDDKAPAEVRVDEVDPSPVTEIPEKKRKPPTDNVLMSILDQLKDTDEEILLEVESHKIKLTHLNKALWPAQGGRGAITKRDLLEYLARVSTYFLPHLKDRPLTLTRYPNGITGEHFFQKHEENAPEFVRTVSLRERNTELQEYLVCDNLSTLLWLGQLGNIDIHTWFSRTVSDLHMPKPANHAKGTPDYFSYYPDFIVFDIDPYIYSGKESRGAEPELNRKAFKQTGQVALWLRELLVELSLNSFIKTSGRTGLHVFVPVVRHFQFDAVRSAAKTISTFLLQKHPDEITVDWAVAKRSGKIFLDYNQNVRGKTLASVYSPRPSPEATVSAPIYWDDIGKVYPTDFTLASLPDRLERIGDIWLDILASKKDLDKVI